MTVNELTIFPITGNFDTVIDGALTSFDVTATCTARLPANFAALIADLDIGGGTGADVALAFPPEPFSTTGGVLSGNLRANDPTVLGPVLAAAGITTLYYDVQFSQCSLGYQVPQNFSFIAPTTDETICLTDPDLERYQYGGTVPVVSLPSGITAFGVELIGATNEAAAQALLGIPVGLSAFLGTVASQAAMLALSAAAVGDFCYRSDVSTFYYLTATPAATLANWQAPEAITSVPLSALTTSTSGVLKGNGAGVVAATSGADFMRAHWVNVLDYGADPTGSADSTTAFTNAIAALSATSSYTNPPTGRGGWVYAPVGTYKISSTLTLAPFHGIRGDGKQATVIKYTGTGACIDASNGGSGGPGPAALINPVHFRDFTLDGTSAGTGAVGILIGNVMGSTASGLFISNFSTTGGIGIHFQNYSYASSACERNMFTDIMLFHNTTGVVFDTGSFMYSVYEFTTGVNPNQSGVLLENFAVLRGCRLTMRGNYVSQAGSNSGCVLGIDVGNTAGTSDIVDCDFDICVECNLTGVGHKTVVMGSTNGSSYCTGNGVMAFNTASNSFAGPSIGAGSIFNVTGDIGGNDTALESLSLGWNTTVTSGTALFLLYTSGKIQAFTGSAAQVVHLPENYVVAGQEWKLINYSSAVMTVQGYGGGAINTLQPGQTGIYIANVNTPTSTGWDYTVTSYQSPAPVMTTVAVQTSAYTAGLNQIVPCNATSAAFTVTLPNTPYDGTNIVVKKTDSSTNAVTFACAGADVINASGTTSGTLTLQYQAVRLHYYAAAAIWYVVSTDAPLGQLDSRYQTAVAASIVPASGNSVNLGSASDYWETVYANKVAFEGTTPSITGSPTIANPTLTGYAETVQAFGTLTTSKTIPALSNGTICTATLTNSDTCAFTLPAPVVGTSFTLFVYQPSSTGSGTYSFATPSGTLNWPTAGAPGMTQGANKFDILTFISPDGTNWCGSYSQGY